MDAETKTKRMTVKPFVKFVNFQHIMPTRYNLDISEALDKAVGDASQVAGGDKEGKKTLKLDIKKKLEDRYKNLASSKNEKVATGVQ